jgi:hypothetical protein
MRNCLGYGSRLCHLRFYGRLSESTELSPQEMETLQQAGAANSIQPFCQRPRWNILSGWLGLLAFFVSPRIMRTENERDWISVRSEAYSNLELPIVQGRLEASGIETRVQESVIGGWVGRDTARFIQVRRRDYEIARSLLQLG